jgi:esterase/lipase superfamily enzyme
MDLCSDLVMEPLRAGICIMLTLFSSKIRQIAAFATLILFITGCQGAKPPEAVFGIDNENIPAEAVAGAKSHDIFIATTRQSEVNTAVMFSSGRATDLSLAKVTVSIPPNHVPGKIERPRRLPPDPRKEFVLLDPVRFGDDQAFIRSIDAEVEKRAPGERELLLFIHGYNTTLAAAVMRIAQFVEDSNFTGIPVLFSWASRGKAIDYVYDMNSALQARNALIDASDILRRTKAASYAILAHSMGNLLTVEAIRQAQLEGKYDRSGKLKTIILASPDIDLDLFRNQIATLPRDKSKLFVLISEDDKALALSRRIAGGVDRVGDAQASELASLGITVIDLTGIEDEESLNHSKFADSPEVVQLIGRRLNAGDQLHTGSDDGLAGTLGQISQSLTVVNPDQNIFSLGN